MRRGGGAASRATVSPTVIVSVTLSPVFATLRFASQSFGRTSAVLLSERLRLAIVDFALLLDVSDTAESVGLVRSIVT